MYDNEDQDIDSDIEDNEEATPETTVQEEHILSEQKIFVRSVMEVVERTREQHPASAEAIEQTAEGIIGVIEGNGSTTGYILVPRTEDGDLAVLPATVQMQRQHFENTDYTMGLDISGGLSAMFDEINN